MPPTQPACPMARRPRPRSPHGSPGCWAAWRSDITRASICIACNTASTIALGMVRDVLETPIVGTVPAIKPAAAMTRSGTIGLLGTAATIRQAYVDNLEAEFANGNRLLRHAAPELVAAAEASFAAKHPIPRCSSGLRQGCSNQNGGEKIDTVVLACTHFPLVQDELAKAFGKNVSSLMERKESPAASHI